MMDIREKLVELLTESFDAQYNQRQLITPVHTADNLIANGVTVQEEGYWINDPPYRAMDGSWKKAQECSVCHSVFVSDGNTPYSNHPYCCECGARLSPQPPKGE